MIRTIYYFAVFLSFTFVAFLIFVVLWFVTVLFDRNRVVVHCFSRFWAKTIYRISPWWKIKLEGLENIEKGKSYIILSNHQAMLDIPLLYYLPLDFKWISKKEVYYIPVFGWVLWMHGDIAIERGGVASAKKMMTDADKYLKRGVSVSIFPEGTRTKDGQVHEFHPGAFLMAKKSKVDVLPVVINGTFDAFGPKGGKTRIAAPHTFTIKIMPAMPAAEVAKLRFNEICEKMETTIRTEHQRIAPRFYNNTESPA